METNIKLLVVLQKLNSAFLNQVGKNINDLGLTLSEFQILAHLNEKEQERTQKLGEIAFITSGTITYTVNKLVRQSFVEKFQDDADKRVFWVRLTDAGKTRYAKFFKEHKVYLDHLLGQFTEQKKQDFIDQIKYFGKKIEANTKE
jgi:MarR family transcriptional regulator, 2-MHQ and catechol-resistance regulon repressor